MIDSKWIGREMDGPADTRSPGKQIVKKNNLDINFVGAGKALPAPWMT
ncbi:MAG: hypothetical protein O3C29_13540 [Proteobacteria bacterium]|nr:hypothetical protein [Pseudomonadota bacterium]MDA1290717.1 hypothetical protein [Pseudomonadota bacterium]